MKRWDAKDKICAETKDVKNQGDICQVSAQKQILAQAQMQQTDETLKKTATDDALARLIAERKKLENYWNQ